jgi:hypothetical protein
MDDSALIKSVLNQTDAKYNSADLNIAYRMKVRSGTGLPNNVMMTSCNLLFPVVIQTSHVTSVSPRDGIMSPFCALGLTMSVVHWA